MQTVNTVIKEIFQKPSTGDSPTTKLDKILEHEQSKRLVHEQQWKLATAFLEGYQWTSIDPKQRILQRKDSETSNRASWRVRLISDQILPAVQNRLAKLTKVHPSWTAVPSTGDISEVEAARLVEGWLEFYHKKLNFDDKLKEALLYSFISAGYIEVYWDDQKGEPIDYIIDPETQEQIPNDGLRAQSLHKLAKQAGQDIEVLQVYEGDVGLEVCSPFEIYLFGSNDPQEAHSAIKVKGYSPDYVEDRWGKKVDADGSDALTIGNGRLPSNERSELAIVKQLYVRPSKKNPKGLYYVWCGDKVLYKGDFPYDDAELPFVKFPGIKIPGATYDSSWLYRLIPLQRELNATVSQIAEYKNLTLWPQLIAPENSLLTKPTSRPGAVIYYRPRAYGQGAALKPEFREPHSLPGYIFTWVDNILQRFNDISGQHEISRGQTPTNVEAGFAIELLQEQDDTSLGPHIRDMENGISLVGQKLVSRADQGYDEGRIMSLKGAAGYLENKEVTADVFRSIDSVFIETGSLIPKSEAARNNTLFKMYEKGDVSAQDYLSVTEIGGKALITSWEANRRKQQREIQMMEAGHDVAIPAPFDDPGSHLEVIIPYLLSGTFEQLLQTDPQAAAKILDHYEQHQQAVDKAKEQALNDQIRVAAALKIDAADTPSVAAAILAKQGVTVDPQQMAQEIDQRAQIDAGHAQDNVAAKSQSRQQEQGAKAMTKAQLDAQTRDHAAQLAQQGEAIKSQFNLDNQKNLELTKSMLRDHEAELAEARKGVAETKQGETNEPPNEQ